MVCCFSQNPLKPSKILLNEYQRLHLVRVAIEDDINFKVSDEEFKLPKPSYTIDTLTILKEKYPDNSFGIIMGSDSYNNLSNWKNPQKIISENFLIVYKRPGFEVEPSKLLSQKICILENAPLLDISSTEIRKLIKAGKSIRYLVTENVREEIERSGYYKK